LITLIGNDITASNISITDQKVRTHFPSTNTTLGVFVQAYDQWAEGWGNQTANKGIGTKAELNNINVSDKSAMVGIAGFETVTGSDITTPVLIVESSKNVNIDNLKVDDIHLSNLYYTAFGGENAAYFNPEDVNLKGVTAITEGRDIKLNQSFDPDTFDTDLDKVYGYDHNLIVLQYLNGDFGKVAGQAKNTNMQLVNYVDAYFDGNNVVLGSAPTIDNPTVDDTDTNRSLDGDWGIEKIAEDLDTVFRKQFMPKSFAASDDEIEQMKQKTLAGTLMDESGKIKIMQPFKAH